MNWCDKSCAGGNHPIPAVSDRLGEHTPPLRLPLTNIPRSQKSNHPTCSHPSCAHDDYTQNHGWGEQSTGKCGTQVCLLRWLMKLREKIDTNTLVPKNVPPNSIDNARTTAKVGGPQDLPTKVKIKKNRYNPRKKGYEGRNGSHPCQPKKRHELPAILRRCTSKSNARATESSQGSVRDKLVNSVVRLRLNRLLRQIFFNGRCQTAFCRSKRTTRGTVVKTSFSNVCTMVAEQLGWAVRNEWKTRSATCFRESSQGFDWWRGITWGSRGRKETIGGTPMGTLFSSMEKRSVHE